MEVIAIIPARGGSKRIKDKNIRDVGGRPLIYYQIQNALDVPEIKRIVVATDSGKIAGVALGLFGDKIEVVMRPPEISNDLSKTEETLLYVLDRIPADIVVTLEPTNPLNRPQYISDCIWKVVNGGFDSALCAVEDYSFFLDDTAHLLERPMHQQIKPRLRETGNCWVTKTDILKATNNRLGGNFGVVIIPQEDSYHLDSEEDWKIIEALIRNRVYYTTRESSTERGHDR